MLISLSKDWLDKNLIEPNEPSCYVEVAHQGKKLTVGFGVIS